MYRSTQLAKRGNTKTWKTATIHLSNATFAGNQNWASDFRLSTYLTPLTVSDVTVKKLP
jgi:hypothetical protein